MRRLFIAIVLCLLLGLFTSVAVSWLAAFGFAPGGALEQLNEHWDARIDNSEGATSIALRPASVPWLIPPDEAEVQQLSPPLRALVNEEPETDETVIVALSAGWPKQCFYYVRRTDGLRFIAQWDYEDEGVIAGGMPFVPRGPIGSELLLPIKPYWPGLIVNTLIFAGVWYILPGLGYLNRINHAFLRRRKKKCPFCRYDLRASTLRCPECGRHQRERTQTVGRWAMTILLIQAALAVAVVVGFVILVTNNSPRPPLHYAAYKGDAGRVTRLLDDGADPNELIDISAGSGFDVMASPLTAAAASGDRDIVSMLIERGAQINQPQGAQPAYPALSVAVDLHYFEIAEFLLAAGADVNRGFTDDFSPLSISAMGDKKAAVNFLLQNGADPNSDELTLPIALRLGHNEIAAILIEHGAEPSNHAMSSAVRRGNIEAVRAMLECGGSFTDRTPSGETLLFAAARDSGSINKQFWQEMIDAGVDVNARDARGSTALMRAAGSDHPMLELFLLQHSADVDAMDKRGMAALNFAVDNNSRLCVVFLLAWAADPHAALSSYIDVLDDDVEQIVVDAIKRWEEFDTGASNQ